MPRRRQPLPGFSASTQLLPIFRRVFNDAYEPFSTGDPVDAETFVSSVVASVDDHADQGPEEVGAELVQFLAGVTRTGTPQRRHDAVVFLRTLAQLDGHPACDAAARQLAEGGGTPSHEAGQPQFLRAWELDDVFGDSSLYTSEWQVAGQEVHGMVVAIDNATTQIDELELVNAPHELVSARERALASGDPEAHLLTPEPREVSRLEFAGALAQALVDVESLAATALHARDHELADVVAYRENLRPMLLGRMRMLLDEELRESGYLGVSAADDDSAPTRWRATRELLLHEADADAAASPALEDQPPAVIVARSAMLRDAAGMVRLLLPDPGDIADDERERVVEAFMQSPFAPGGERYPSSTTDDAAGIADGDVRAIVASMVDFHWYYADADPTRWGPATLATFLLDWCPRKLAWEEDDWRPIPAVARAVALWGAHERELPEPAIEHLLRASDEIAQEFPDAMQQSGRGGFGMRIAEQLQRDGVDPSDPQALERWMQRFNELSFEERGRVLGTEE